MRVVTAGLCLLMVQGCSSDDSGDDGGGSGGAAGGGSGGSGGMTLEPNPACPSGAPEPKELYGACCFRASNADNASSPAFRIAAMEFSSPVSLSDPFVVGLIANSFDEERMNWVLALEGADADGDITVRIGHTDRSADGKFSFTSGAAPGPGDPARWDPITVDGTLTGESWSTETAPMTLGVPVLDGDRTGIMIELPFRDFRVTGADMTSDRSCIGERLVTSFDLSAGEASAFLTVEESAATHVTVSPTLQFALCSLIAGVGQDDCATTPRTEWTSPPDSLCGADGCTSGGCDPMSDCNAWALAATFAAQGVELVE